MSHSPIPAPSAGSSRSTHLDLLERARALAAHARALQVASDASEVDVLHGELCLLRNALVEHVHAEGEQLDGLSPAAREAIEEGQRRLLRQVEAIMADSAADGAGCDCVGRSVHLVGMLAAQVRAEAGVQARQVARRTGR